MGHILDWELSLNATEQKIRKAPSQKLRDSKTISALVSQAHKGPFLLRIASEPSQPMQSLILKIKNDQHSTGFIQAIFRILFSEDLITVVKDNIHYILSQKKKE